MYQEQEKLGFPPSKVLQQYSYLLDQIKATERERASGRRTFAALNVAMVSTGVLGAFLQPLYEVPGSSDLLFSLLLLIIPGLGFILSMYWFQEEREWGTLHSIRFRALLELERTLGSDGPLQWEWDHMGSVPSRTSPVFYVPMGNLLPVIFSFAHLGVFAGLILVSIWTGPGTIRYG